jgi:hypothetical protein
MHRRDSEEGDAAPPPPSFTTLTKLSRNGACHAKPDAEGTESKSDADVEKQFDESTGILA